MAAPNSTFDQTLSAATYKYLTEGKFRDQISSRGLGSCRCTSSMAGFKPVDGGHSVGGGSGVCDQSHGRQLYSVARNHLSGDGRVHVGVPMIGSRSTARLPCRMMDLAKNAGESRVVVNLLKAKVSNLERSMRQNINQQLFSGHGCHLGQHPRPASACGFLGDYRRDFALGAVLVGSLRC
jgi:hypothetical protein